MKKVDKIIENCLAAGDSEDEVLILRNISSSGLMVKIPGIPKWNLLIKPADDWDESVDGSEALTFFACDEYGNPLYELSPAPKRGTDPLSPKAFAFWVCTILANLQDYAE